MIEYVIINQDNILINYIMITYANIMITQSKSAKKSAVWLKIRLNAGRLLQVFVDVM